MSGMGIGNSIALGTLGFIITVESLVVCFMVYRYRTLRTFNNGFVVSLVLSDILFGAVLLPVIIYDANSLAAGFLVAVILMANVTNMFAVTLDRFLAVMKPLIYHVTMAKHFTKIVVLAWVLPIAITLIPVAYDGDRSRPGHKIYLFGILIIGILIPYIFILVAYVMIFREVSRQVRKLAKLQNIRFDQDALKEGKRVTGEARMARVFALIAGIFVLTWLPVVYMTVVEAIDRFETLVPEVLATISWYTLCMGSVTNAPIYALFKSDFRKAFQKMLRLRKTRFQCLQETSSSLLPQTSDRRTKSTNDKHQLHSPKSPKSPKSKKSSCSQTSQH